MSTSTCRNCGLPNPPDATACARCGAPFSSAGGWAQPSPYYAPPQPKKGSTGKTIAIVVAIVVAFGVVVVGVIAAIAVPALLRARAAANESSAIGTLRLIGSAEAAYESNNAEYGTLAEMRKENLLGPEYADNFERNGYRFHEVVVSADGFEFTAEPTAEMSAGNRSFNITQEYVIRFREGTQAPRGSSGTPIGQ
jgi:type II secretory pathway pseudopilin PulG